MVLVFVLGIIFVGDVGEDDFGVGVVGFVVCVVVYVFL